MRKNNRCPYSDSCFECPLSDCAIEATSASTVNILPGETQRRVSDITPGAERRKINEWSKEVAKRRVRHTANNKRAGTD